MAQGKDSPQRRRYWLITSPRTASNLLVKMLNLDEQGVRPAKEGGYFFLPSIPRRFGLITKPMESWTEEERKALDQSQQECFDKFQDHITAAERDGEILYVKEHAIMLNSPFFESNHVHGTSEVEGEPRTLLTKHVPHPTRSQHNLTFLPDEFLNTWHPTFLIRHPAMMFPSLYRTCLTDLEVDGFKRDGREPMKTEVTTKWTRNLYNFYSNHFEKDSLWPIVLDADDVMTCPELVAKYAQLAGLDDSKIRYSWDKASAEKLNKLSPMEQRMLSSINASSKIDKSKVAGSINIDEEAVKWRSEFGEEGGRKLEQWVRDAMPDYNFMFSRRLRLE
ncbi:hypothetical protein FDECE_3088 [Fusarium decemcellulare]|nr:hypothetical protein FDECE_3088 [Fusarium decemcellulare]